MTKDYLSENTIAAISTAEGEGGIAVIRISGNKSIEIISSIFSVDIDKSEERKLLYGNIISDKSKNTVDTVLVSFMRAPHSYTGEDVVEIYCHGGFVLPRKVLNIVNKSGARTAGPGEFTKRAFLNGKMDLTQAESVVNIITAQSDAGLIQAELQLSGVLSNKINGFKSEILDLYAEIEAQIDFPEEDIDPLVRKELIIKTRLVSESLNTFVSTYDTGKILKDGVITAIVGKPNVGKSSLLNLILKEDRAIVSPIPGTTRDFIEERVNINGLTLNLIDTAGIRRTSDKIEKLGVDLAIGKIDQSEFIIMVLDGSTEVDENDLNILEKIKDRNFILVINKNDLELQIDIKSVLEFTDEEKIVYISAAKETGFPELCQLIEKSVLGSKINSESSELYLTEARHKNSLSETLEHLNNFLFNLESGESLEIMSMELRSSLDHLGEITGEVTNEDLLGRIFSKFCIGK